MSLKTVASPILADVDLGYQPGGKDVVMTNSLVKLERFCERVGFSRRQDAALYGRPGGPPPLSC